MIAAILFVSSIALFIVVVGGLLKTTLGPLTETDRLCSDTDEDLDRRYGGWRN